MIAVNEPVTAHIIALLESVDDVVESVQNA